MTVRKGVVSHKSAGARLRQMARMIQWPEYAERPRGGKASPVGGFLLEHGVIRALYDHQAPHHAHANVKTDE